jgi:hypothetical protein
VDSLRPKAAIGTARQCIPLNWLLVIVLPAISTFDVVQDVDATFVGPTGIDVPLDRKDADWMFGRNRAMQIKLIQKLGCGFCCNFTPGAGRLSSCECSSSFGGISIHRLTPCSHSCKTGKNKDVSGFRASVRKVLMKLRQAAWVFPTECYGWDRRYGRKAAWLPIGVRIGYTGRAQR